MSTNRAQRMRRAYIVDVILGVGLALLLGIEAMSFVTAVGEAESAPSGLVLDASDAAPGGIAVGGGVRLFDGTRVVDRGGHGDCRAL